jgi:hypothetical protein
MFATRKALFERLEGYEKALQQESIVTKSLSEIPHNAQARLFRNGLAVVSFAMLEDFIKERTAEITQQVGNGVTAFADLPHALRVAATAGVTKALNFQSKLLDRRSNDYFAHYQTHSEMIASTKQSRFRISPFAFGYDQPNLNAEAVKNILTSFHIKDPWNAIRAVSIQTGVGIPALKETFENAMYRRHKAAHNADTDIELSDLSAFATEIRGIALSIDLLLSLALRKMLDGEHGFLDGSDKITSDMIDLRVISFDSSTKMWREVVSGKKRATARNKDFETLKVDCFKRARPRQQGVVVHNARGLPKEWYTPYVD